LDGWLDVLDGLMDEYTN